MHTCKQCIREKQRGSKEDWQLGDGPGDRLPEDQKPTDMHTAEGARWIPGLEGRYAVTIEGRVLSYTRNWSTPSGGRELSQKKLDHGYMSVGLHYENSCRHICVHTLVLVAFRGKHETKEHCRHLDGNRSNNNLCNLRWGTPAENYEDARDHGTARIGEDRYNSKLTRSQVIEIRRRYRTGNWSCDGLGDEYGVTGDTVQKIIHGQNWKHVGGPIAGEDYVMEGQGSARGPADPQPTLFDESA
jgi:hypothetical protein